MHKLTQKTKSRISADTSLTLTYEQRTKSRLRVQLDNQEEAGLFLERGTVLHDGDRLIAADGFSVEVKAASEPVSTAFSKDQLTIALACYHLGNRHVPVQINSGWVRYQADHVLDDMLRGLGLTVANEEAPFSPESGAYTSHHGHHHHD